MTGKEYQNFLEEIAKNNIKEAKMFIEMLDGNKEATEYWQGKLDAAEQLFRMTKDIFVQ